MGLQRGRAGVPVQVEGQQQFNIQGAVAEFRHAVNSYCHRKPGMEVHVSHIRRKQIPAFVFPGGEGQAGGERDESRNSLPKRQKARLRPTHSSSIFPSRRQEDACTDYVNDFLCHDIKWSAGKASDKLSDPSKKRKWAADANRTHSL
ncbi:hypothetical protein GOP47_0024423 [Adiantum capillus-veneris]|uniref:Uncharacterized protein n=1 Tax=Adiantum capillus-veneris TaxID=13818 RepID=A0A9D4U2X1_ADICA|nr:hypothetical protein GOP47_0024423 [Adiantum capillus-veneris]